MKSYSSLPTSRALVTKWCNHTTLWNLRTIQNCRRVKQWKVVKLNLNWASLTVLCCENLIKGHWSRAIKRIQVRQSPRLTSPKWCKISWMQLRLGQPLKVNSSLRPALLRRAHRRNPRAFLYLIALRFSYRNVNRLICRVKTWVISTSIRFANWLDSINMRRIFPS